MTQKKLDGLKFTWWAPSNIALVKYWGKKVGHQLPANPSVSLTLSTAKTRVSLSVVKSVETTEDTPWIDLYFAGQQMPSFIPKIEKFFKYASGELPFLNDYKFLLKTENTFPHSAGIASSASSMAALALNLIELEQVEKGVEYSKEEFLKRASFIARMGSGSACRSLYPFAASWGESDNFGSDLWAEPVDCHPIFKSMYDSIVVVNSAEKKVSSRAGHGLMDEHFYGKARYHHALTNWNYSIGWLKEGAWDNLGNLVEEEALSLHAMMMTSRPGYLLMEPQTITAIQLVREYRYRTGVPIYFTLDAGPNLHLLYPQDVRAEVQKFLEDLKKDLGANVTIIDDKIGTGPYKEDGL
ncbi:MAG: hypothetical protein K9K67_04435 [Bacteriovoracaceae bacterium]|nr:hypothetical protein [Bacteriovoracaceae bacterium]